MNISHFTHTKHITYANTIHAFILVYLPALKKKMLALIWNYRRLANKASTSILVEKKMVIVINSKNLHLFCYSYIDKLKLEAHK